MGRAKETPRTLKEITVAVETGQPVEHAEEVRYLLNVVKFDIKKAAKRLYEGLDTPFSRRLATHLENDDIASLVSERVDVESYSNAYDYALDRQALDFLRKYPFPGNAEKTALAAKTSMLKAEARCAETNERFRLFESGRYKFDPDVEAVLYSARYKISKLLGDLDVEEWIRSCRFGPGFTLGSKAESAYEKLAEDPSTTTEFLPYALNFLEEYQGWVDAITYDGTSSFAITVHPGGKFATVPKDALTDRGIETQPLINAFAQRGLGVMIGRRLMDVKIDLSTGQDVNRELARVGSITGYLSTRDLSSASDTVASNLVRWLLSGNPSWLHAMEITRTHKVLVDGEWQHLHRFSAMGNGFTFELETLIFWALVRSACPTGEVVVFGDDIICPTEFIPLVDRVLDACGFWVNARKSYSTGPFRESCGADWWLGTNVRPHFQKKEVTDVASLISLANGLSRAARRCAGSSGTDKRFAAVILHCLRRIPPSIRRRIAMGETPSDDYILWRSARPGKRVTFKSQSFVPSQWYPAKGAVLYGSFVADATTERKLEALLAPPRLERRMGSENLRNLACRAGDVTSGQRQYSYTRRETGEYKLASQPRWAARPPEVWRDWL